MSSEEVQGFPINNNTIFSFLHSRGFISCLEFAFNGKVLVIGGKTPNPILYQLDSNRISVIGKVSSSQTGNVAAIAISNDGKFCATGYPDGSIVLWNIEINSAGARYKLIHETQITHIAFIGDQVRLIIADESGIITLLSLVQSLSCELILQTTIINLKSPITAFVSHSPDLVAFASKAGYSLLSVGRKIEALVNQPPSLDSPITSAIHAEGERVRAILCTKSTMRLYDFENRESNPITFLTDYEDEIAQCFFFTHDKILLVLTAGKALIVGIDGKIINTIENLPAEVSPKNIQFRERSLLFFLDNTIVQTIVPE